MSDYTKKKMGLIFLSIGLGLIASFFLIRMENETKSHSILSFQILAIFIGFGFLVVGIVLLCLIPSKDYIRKYGKEGYCKILRVETSRSAGRRVHYVSYYFLVEYVAENGMIAKDGVKCSKEEMKLYESGTKLFCYIKGKSIYVPRPFQVVKDNKESL